jgi:hypothetical protein
MNPELVIWAIRSLTRLGRVAGSALEQKVRDRDLILPRARSAGFSLEAWLQEIFYAADNRHLIEPGGPLHDYWDGVRPRGVPAESMERLVAAALDIELAKRGRAEPVPGSLRDENVAFVIVCQWAQEVRPVHPYARIVLALADIALEYVAANPSVLALGGNGEKLVQAIAANLSGIVPDDVDPERLGRQRRLGERLVAALFRGGLQAIVAHPEYTLATEHLRSLIAKTIPPIVAALPAGEGGLEFEVSWSEVGGALLGPAAMAALGVLADEQRACFGSRFDPGTAVGAVTRAVLESARADGDLRRAFSDDGLIRIHRAILGVAASSPELFVGSGEAAGMRVARDLLGGIARTIADAGPPVSRTVVLATAAAGLDALGRNAGSLIRLDPAWDRTAIRLVQHVIEGFRTELATGDGRLARVFAGDELVQLARIVLGELARNPSMVGLGTAAGDDPRHRLVGGIVGVVAHAMAQDRHGLLAAGDWLKIVTVAARQAARNPERLFRLDVLEPGEQLAAKLISHLLAAAGVAGADGRPRDGALLFSDTLRELIVIALDFGAEHAVAATERSEVVRDLALRIEMLARRAGAGLGADQLVAVFRRALPRALAIAGSVVAGEGELEEIGRRLQAGKLDEAAERLVR